MIDLRSDTVTRPTPSMREAMEKADVGDDVFGEDPTINQLQEKVAAITGKEDGLFVASGTMANQVSIKTHTQPGDEIILETGSHIFHYESGAPAFLSGVQLQTINGKHGVITSKQIEAVIRPQSMHCAQTRLIWLENTHNRAGGTVFPLEEIRKIRVLSDSHALFMHLDGARLWNAHIATGIPLSEYARYFDSVSVCFSKGLGAPVGSMILGSAEFIHRARRIRKIFGGGMRQAGIIAAGALYAVEHHISRMKEDHDNARFLAEILSALPGVHVDLTSVQTNIVYFDVSQTGKNGDTIQELLQKNGVQVISVGPTRLRAVTHLDISRQQIEQAAIVFKKIFQ
ncbi:low-specificity L-threonine aldolase [bacterium]|nr:low-specificity L-threonine aldolase [bacterium]